VLLIALCLFTCWDRAPWSWEAKSGVEREPIVYSGSYLEYVQKLGHEAPGIYS
jgi:hypothetical protein